MERKHAIAVAAATVAIGCSAALAVGANFGLFGLAAGSPVAGPSLPVHQASAETPIPPDPVAEVRYVDVPVRLAVPRDATVSGPPEVVIAQGDTTTGTSAVESDSPTDGAPEVGYLDDDGNEVKDDHDAEDDHGTTTSQPEHTEDHPDDERDD